MRLLLGGIIVSLGLSTLPVQAQQQVTNTQIGAMVEALRLAAPKTAKRNDGLYSEWQITPGIIPSWSKQCLGRELTPQELEASPAKAREVVSCIARRELQKQYVASNSNEAAAVRRTACWWMTGTATGCNSGITGTYVQRVLDFYEQSAINSATPTASNYRPQMLKK